MVGLGKGHVDKFMNYSQTQAMRNMLGGARAVFIGPDIGGEALLVGVDSGSDFLLKRHGEDWSDPVFYTLTETSAGEQLGIVKAHVIVLAMTDMAVTNFENGNMVVVTELDQPDLRSAPRARVHHRRNDPGGDPAVPDHRCTPV
jgi:lipid-binding SYLF domain-containing protein